ncbi:RNA polymerase sigma factor [Subtercola vilae]|uniref:RNA polymerase sigma factor n=1 Tax=Subtercola vilae TaxID=2056433 RepID=UPI00137608E0|nr:sigma-70 family RNA polymerase sigma factor [Subtercola vilae]
MKHAYDSEAIDQLHSDIDLVALTREGDTRAFAELWARHAGAGQAFARGFSSYDAEDLTIEAFSNILASVRAGAGPTAGFRPYLLSTIRNVARNWSRKADPITTDELDHLADPATEEAAELAALDSGITATAFRSLPTRWQEVLWYSEVEAMKPREIAPLLGMSANSVSALVIRAKAGLRAAWVQAHLKKSHDPACAAVAGFFASYSLGSLAKKNVDAVDRHLAVCERDCVIVLEEASHVSSMLVLVLLPLVTGVAGAGGYLAYTQAGAHAAVSASPVWTTGSVHAIPGGSRAHLASATVKTPVTRVGLVAGIAVVAAVVIIGASVTFALILGSSGRVKTAPDAGAPVAMPSPESSPLATAIPEPASTPAAPDAPVTPLPTDAPAQKTTPRISTYTVPVSNIDAPTAVPLTTPEVAPATTLPTPHRACAGSARR